MATDPLTGFEDAATFSRALDDAIAGASAGELDALWVGIVAIPRLSSINAGFGHECADDVIRALGTLMREELPEAIILGRLEGAELAVASFGPARRLTLRDSSDPVRFLGLTVETADTRLFVNLRAGLAYCTPGDDAAAVLVKARIALAAARDGQASDREIYDETMGALAAERIDIARELFEAIENDALSLVYQPKVDIPSGAMVGAEALLRWTRADGSSISPGVFVPAAEASGLIVPLGDWVLREGCRQIARWRDQGLAPFHTAINVSSLQFQKTDIVARVSELMSQIDVPPEWLELEITEGALAGEAEDLVKRLHALRELGIELAVDDFGTGYSSLSYLKRFPVHRLKIDQSFVRYSHENEQDRAMVKSIVGMGRNLGLKVLAEGVESEAHVSMLANENCSEAQGYYYSKPLSADALSNFARANRAEMAP